MLLVTYEQRTDIDYLSKVVSCDTIGENGYNISVSTYVAQEDTREVIDINVLNSQISEVVLRIKDLRNKIDDIISEIEG